MKGGGTPVVTVTGYGIYEAVADVGTQWGLTHLCAFLLDGEGQVTAAGGVADGYGTDGCGCVGAHEPGLAAHSWGGKLDAGGEVPAVGMNCVGQC